VVGFGATKVAVAWTPSVAPVGGAIVNVGTTVQTGGVIVVIPVPPVPPVPPVVLGLAIVRAGFVQIPVPPKLIPVTDHHESTAVAVTVAGQPVRVTVGIVVYPAPPFVIVALSVVAAGTVVPVTVAIAPVLPVPVGRLIVTAGDVHVPVPPNVIPVTDHHVSTAVAVTVAGQPVRVTVGIVVYPAPPFVIVALRSVARGTVVPVTVATAGVVIIVGAERVRVGSVVQLVAPVKLMPETLVPVRTAVAVGLFVHVPLTVTVGAVKYPVPPLVIVAPMPVILSRAIAPVPTV